MEDIDSFGINVNQGSVVNISENIAYCKFASLEYGVYTVGTDTVSSRDINTCDATIIDSTKIQIN